jgi:small subunit ribosomal protein S20
MPVTKTAKRALRGSKIKEGINKLIISKLEAAMRNARRQKTAASVVKATSLADKAAKKKYIHKNKAARIKSQLSKLLSKTGVKKPVGTVKVKPGKKSKSSKK